MQSHRSPGGLRCSPHARCTAGACRQTWGPVREDAPARSQHLLTRQATPRCAARWQLARRRKAGGVTSVRAAAHDARPRGASPDSARGHPGRPRGRAAADTPHSASRRARRGVLAPAARARGPAVVDALMSAWLPLWQHWCVQNEQHGKHRAQAQHQAASTAAPPACPYLHSVQGARCRCGTTHPLCTKKLAKR
jgi:hypothetical protein